MGFFSVVSCFAGAGLIAIVLRGIVRRRSPEGKAAKNEVDRRKALGEAGFLSSLPTIFYFLAIFCGIILLVGTVSRAQQSSDAETGAMISYTVGAALSMFAVGRVIQFLQKSHAALNTLIEIEKFKLKRSDSNAPVE